MRQPIFGENETVIYNRISELLDQIENLQGKIGLGYGKSSIEILSLMDNASDRIFAARNQGLIIPSEEAQFNSIIETYRSQAEVFLREIGGVSVLEALRDTTQPIDANWWWWPERIVAQKRATQAKYYIRMGAISLVVIVVVVGVYQIFLKPSPSVMAAQRALQGAQQIAQQVAMDGGDIQTAIPLLDEGLKAAPNDPELLVLKGSILSILPDRGSEAVAVFTLAESTINNRELFLLQRAQAYFVLNQLELAFNDAQTAVDLNPQSARGFLILGQMLESQKEFDKAYATYEKASNLASEQSDSYVAAQARIKMGMVMQLMGVNAFNPVSPTPTP